MTKLSGAILKAVKRSIASEEKILAAIDAAGSEPVAEPVPRKRRGTYNRRDMTAAA